jgi:hypothetical protein
MPELTGLPGVKRKTVPCKMVRSISAALTVTRRTATTAANDNGAISIWIDDAGNTVLISAATSQPRAAENLRVKTN